MVDDKADIAAFENYKVDNQEEVHVEAPKAEAVPDKPVEAKVEVKVEEKVVAKSAQVDKVDVQAKKSGEKIFISPWAKKTAIEAGIDYNLITGTGPNGRIVHEDVIKYGATEKANPIVIESPQVQAQVQAMSAPNVQPHTGNYQDVEVSNMRRVIAERLVLSKTTIPHFYVTVNCNMDEVMRKVKYLTILG
jgi:pyruvate dehydrogenase E2 component (dihydrolipoamide acetyltransferase)